MDVYTAERCEARARRCMDIFQCIASGDFKVEVLRLGRACTKIVARIAGTYKSAGKRCVQLPPNRTLFALADRISVTNGGT